MRIKVAIFLSCLLFLCSTSIRSQDAVKNAVVRVQNTKTSEVGAGFVVKVAGNKAYLVTASHIVSGDQHPNVYLFSDQAEPLSATLIDREDDDVRGLALLRLTGNSSVLSSLTELKLQATQQLGNGENVSFLGFPGGTSLWTVDRGSVKRLEGNYLVLSGSVRKGNSGGPVILDQQAIGMVTDVSQSDIYAARAEIIVSYVNGLIGSRITISDSRESRKDDFCQTLVGLVSASKGGFYSIVGKATDSESTFYSNVTLPEAQVGYVEPGKRAYFSFLSENNKGKAETLFYAYITRARSCLTGWHEKTDSDSSYRYHKFRKERGGVVVSVYYTPVAQRGIYYVSLDLALPSKDRSEW